MRREFDLSGSFVKGIPEPSDIDNCSGGDLERAYLGM